MLPALADEHVQSAIVNGLIRRGMDAVTAQERGLQAMDDEEILAAATSEGRMVLTNDTDFLALHSRWLATGRDHSGIVYWPQTKYTIGQAVRLIIAYTSRTAPADAANQLHYL